MLDIRLIVLGSLFLRLVLADQSFWLDEGATLVIARQPLGILLSSLKSDFHPPLFYLLIHALLKLSVSAEILLRLPNIIFGTVTVYVTYLLVSTVDRKFGKLTGPLAALFLALNPLHIYYSQELRMYALSGLLTVLGWLFITATKKRMGWFTLVTVLNFYTFYGAFLNFATQIFYLYWQDRKTLKKNWPWLGLPIVAFMPWLPTFVAQLAGSEYLQTALPGWRALSGVISPKALILIPIKFILGRINLAYSSLAKIIGGLSSLYFLGLVYWGRKTNASKIFLAWLIVPLLLALVLSVKSPMLGYWRYIYLLPAFVALIALGIARLKPPYRQINIVIVLTIFAAANLSFWLTPQYQREDWRGIRQLENQFNQLTTLYVFAFSDAFAPFRWYMPNAQYVAPLTQLRSSPEELDAILSQATQSKSTVLYFEYLAQLTDPEKNIVHWLENAGYALSQTHNFNGVGFVHEYHPEAIY